MRREKRVLVVKSRRHEGTKIKDTSILKLMFSHMRLSRIGILLYLLLFCTSVFAQESGGFNPPKALKIPVVRIPDNFSLQYSPPEVLVLVNVLPDSTATLVKILDPKPELLDYVLVAMDSARFQPAIMQGEVTDATFTLKLPIVRDVTLNEVSG